MSWTDALLAGAIVLGAAYLIYRSLWKKQGYCPGCDARTCGSRPHNLRLDGPRLGMTPGALPGWAHTPAGEQEAAATSGIEGHGKTEFTDRRSE